MKLTMKLAFHALSAPLLFVTLTSIGMDESSTPSIMQYKIKKDPSHNTAYYGSSQVRDIARFSLNMAVCPNEPFIMVCIKQNISEEHEKHSKEVAYLLNINEEEAKQHISTMKDMPVKLFLPISSLLGKKNGDIVATMNEDNIIEHYIYHDSEKNQFSQDLQAKMQQFKLLPDVLVLNPATINSEINFFLQEGIITIRNGQPFHGPNGYYVKAPKNKAQEKIVPTDGTVQSIVTYNSNR